MPKYTKEFAEKVLRATDIVQVVGRYVPLTKNENAYVGKSPFSSAHNKTLVVYSDKQVFKDFATKEAGNAIIFVAHKEKISFDAALEKLARAAHITITEADYYKDPNATKKKKLYAVMEAAATFYCNQIKAAGGEKALEYIASRNIEDKTMKQFRLGYAPAKGKALYNYLLHQGFTEQVMLESGLIKKSEEGFYDYFRNRLMFPIWNRDGQVVAFTGRTLTPDVTPKYVNSAASLIFNKSETLYGINFAKNTKKTYYILVEGQMDVIKMHQAGFDNVIAISGVAATEQHLLGLSTRVENGKEVPMVGLMIATDNDEAGKEAKKKIIKKGYEVLPFGMRVMLWDPQYKDLDETVDKAGPEYVKSCIQSALPADNFIILCVYEKTHSMEEVAKEIVQNMALKDNRGMAREEQDTRMIPVMETLAISEIDRER